MNETQKKAIEKIDKEVKEFKGDKYGKVICKPVANALKQFCGNERFAAAILNSDKTLSDCCKAVTESVKESLSDADAYRKAVQFYFPDADIKFDMRIILSGEETENTNIVEAADPRGDDEVISIFDVLWGNEND